MLDERSHVIKPGASRLCRLLPRPSTAVDICVAPQVVLPPTKTNAYALANGIFLRMAYILPVSTTRSRAIQARLSRPSSDFLTTWPAQDHFFRNCSSTQKRISALRAAVRAHLVERLMQSSQLSSLPRQGQAILLSMLCWTLRSFCFSACVSTQALQQQRTVWLTHMSSSLSRS